MGCSRGAVMFANPRWEIIRALLEIGQSARPLGVTSKGDQTGPARDPLRVELGRLASVEASPEPVGGRSRSVVYRLAAGGTRGTEE